MVRCVPLSLLSLTWLGRWYFFDSLYPNMQEGDGPGSHRHLPETYTKRYIAKQHILIEHRVIVMLYFLKLCYFHIFIPLQCLTFFLM